MGLALHAVQYFRMLRHFSVLTPGRRRVALCARWPGPRKPDSRAIAIIYATGGTDAPRPRGLSSALYLALIPWAGDWGGPARSSYKHRCALRRCALSQTIYDDHAWGKLERTERGLDVYAGWRGRERAGGRVAAGAELPYHGTRRTPEPQEDSGSGESEATLGAVGMLMGPGFV